jgi:6-phosphogluconolactonase
VMQASKEVVIAACGVSEKYPKGKSEAMGRGVEGDETPSTFPAVGLRPYADWYLDNAAAQTLSVDYAECFSLDMSRGDCNPDGVDVW